MVVVDVPPCCLSDMMMLLEILVFVPECVRRCSLGLINSLQRNVAEIYAFI